MKVTMAVACTVFCLGQSVAIPDFNESYQYGGQFIKEHHEQQANQFSMNVMRMPPTQMAQETPMASYFIRNRNACKVMFSEYGWSNWTKFTDLMTKGRENEIAKALIQYAALHEYAHCVDMSDASDSQMLGDNYWALSAANHLQERSSQEYKADLYAFSHLKSVNPTMADAVIDIVVQSRSKEQHIDYRAISSSLSDVAAKIIPATYKAQEIASN